MYRIDFFYNFGELKQWGTAP